MRPQRKIRRIDRHVIVHATRSTFSFHVFLSWLRCTFSQWMSLYYFISSKNVKGSPDTAWHIVEAVKTRSNL